MNTIATVVCTGMKDPKDDKKIICGGGGWWGEDVPSSCPNCGKATVERGKTLVVDL